MSASWNLFPLGFLPHGFCSFQNYFYLPHVLPKPGTCTTVFSDTDTIHSEGVSEHIKARNGFDPQPIIITQRGNAWLFINGENWRKMVSFPPGQNTNLFDFCSIGEYTIRCSGADFKKMVPISHPTLLCASRREGYSWIQGNI